MKDLVESYLFSSIKGLSDAFTLKYYDFSDGAKFIQYLDQNKIDYAVHPSDTMIQVFIDADSVEGTKHIENLRKLGKFDVTWV